MLCAYTRMKANTHATRLTGHVTLGTHPNLFDVWWQAVSSISLITDTLGWDQFGYQTRQGLRILKSQRCHVFTLYIAFILVHYNLLVSSKIQLWISKQTIGFLITNHNDKVPPLFLTSSLPMPVLMFLDDTQGSQVRLRLWCFLCIHHSLFWWFLCLFFPMIKFIMLALYIIYHTPPCFKISLSLRPISI